MGDTTNYEEKILLSVRRIMRAIDIHSSFLARQYGLTSPQPICLKYFSDNGPTAPGTLARAVHLSHATVTGIMNRLEKKAGGKKMSHEDGRSFVINITDAGRIMIKSAPSMLQEQFMHELSRLAEWEEILHFFSLSKAYHPSMPRTFMAIMK